MQNISPPGRRDNDHDRLPLFNQGNRSMLELAGSKALSEGVGNFLQFQCAFHSHRITNMTPQEEEGAGIDHLLCCFFNYSRLCIQNPLDFSRHLLQGSDNLSNFIFIHSALNLSQIEPQQVSSRNLGNKSLGRGNSNFRTGMSIENSIRLTGNT